MAAQAHLPPSTDAAGLLVESLSCQVNQSDIDTILQSQRLMLARFEKTNEMLINCNALAAARYSAAQQEFKRHTQQLVAMKKDLESVFKRIKTIKCKLSQQYPTAFQDCSNVCDILEEATEDSPVQEPDSQTPKKINPQSSSCSQTTTPSPVTSPSTSD